MPIALPSDPAEGRTRQERIHAELRAMILDGRLRAGTRLPASRALGAELAVSRTTAVLALERLESEGYVEGRARVGTFVSLLLPEDVLRARPPERNVRSAAVASGNRIAVPQVPAAVRGGRAPLEFDLPIGRPDPELFPMCDGRAAIEAKLARPGTGLSEHPDPAGEPGFRAGMAAEVGPARGIAATAEDVVVVAGSQESLDLIARMLGSRRRVLVHADPCYDGALAVLGRACGRRVPVAVDEQGLDVARLPDCRHGLLHLTPSHQYPLGCTLAADRRAQVLDWAERTDSYVVEADDDGGFRYEETPLPALEALDRACRVIYLATFSKSLGAGLRLGYLIVPPRLRAAAPAWTAVTSMGCSWLEQAATAELLTSGAFERHLRRIRQADRMRRDRLIAALERQFGPVRLVGRRAGMPLAGRVREGAPAAAELERRALAHGVGVYGLRSAGAWASVGHPRLTDTLRLGSAALSEDAVERAVERLGRAFSGAIGRPRSPACRAPAAMGQLARGRSRTDPLERAERPSFGPARPRGEGGKAVDRPGLARRLEPCSAAFPVGTDRSGSRAEMRGAGPTEQGRPAGGAPLATAPAGAQGCVATRGDRAVPCARGRVAGGLGAAPAPRRAPRARTAARASPSLGLEAASCEDHLGNGSSPRPAPTGTRSPVAERSVRIAPAGGGAPVPGAGPSSAHGRPRGARTCELAKFGPGQNGPRHPFDRPLRRPRPCLPQGGRLRHCRPPGSGQRAASLPVARGTLGLVPSPMSPQKDESCSRHPANKRDRARPGPRGPGPWRRLGGLRLGRSSPAGSWATAGRPALGSSMRSHGCSGFSGPGRGRARWSASTRSRPGRRQRWRADHSRGGWRGTRLPILRVLASPAPGTQSRVAERVSAARSARWRPGEGPRAARGGPRGPADPARPSAEPVRSPGRVRASARCWLRMASSPWAGRSWRDRRRGPPSAAALGGEGVRCAGMAAARSPAVWRRQSDRDGRSTLERGTRPSHPNASKPVLGERDGPDHGAGLRPPGPTRHRPLRDSFAASW